MSTGGHVVHKMSACWHRNVVCCFFISCVRSNVLDFVIDVFCSLRLYRTWLTASWSAFDKTSCSQLSHKVVQCSPFTISYWEISVPVFSERPRSLCDRPSVCRLSVKFVHLTQAIEICGNISMPFGTLAIYWHPGKILRRSSQENPSVGGVEHKRGSRI